MIKFGFDNIPDDYITAFFMIFDPRKTGRTDYKQILDKFNEYANKSMIKDESQRLFKIYDSIRRYMKQKKFNSISSIFLEANVNRKIEISIDMQEFLTILKKIVQVTELSDMRTEQNFAASLLSTTQPQKVDYHKFADYVGYDLSTS